MTLLTMSERELSRLKILEDINEQRLSVVQGAELAGISRRQMTRLVRSFRMHGASGLISKKRGNRAEIIENKRLDAALEMVAAIQSNREVKRSQAAPRRTGQTGHMF